MIVPGTLGKRAMLTEALLIDCFKHAVSGFLGVLLCLCC